MFEYMDEIVEVVAGCIEFLGNVAKWWLLFLLKALILVLTPLWIVPYIIFRRFFRRK